MSNDSGSVITVDGRIDPDDLGRTITHEHLFFDGRDAWYDRPSEGYARKLAEEPVSMDRLWYIRRNLMNHRDNLVINSFAEAVEEVSLFHDVGGDTIVDVTPKNAGSDPEQVRAVSRRTGVQVVQGTAFYVKAAQPDRVESMTVDAIRDEFVDDVRNGVDDTSVRAGIIGEIGLSEQIYESEECVLRGGARAAVETGAPLSIHPPGRTDTSQRDRTYPPSRWALEVLDIVEEEGLAPDRVIMGHMDRTIFEDLSYQHELAERGPYLEYDLWGMESSLDNYGDAYPSDAWRLDAVGELIDAGYGSQLLFSHDVAYKISRTKYGGFGYAHVLKNVVPMLRDRGVDRETIEAIVTDNPKGVLAFDEAG